MEKHFQEERGNSVTHFIGVLFALSSVWMAAAYTVFGAALYASVAAGLASTPGLLMEGAVNTVAALIVWPAVQRFLKK